MDLEFHLPTGLSCHGDPYRVVSTRQPGWKESGPRRSPMSLASTGCGQRWVDTHRLINQFRAICSHQLHKFGQPFGPKLLRHFRKRLNDEGVLPGHGPFHVGVFQFLDRFFKGRVRFRDGQCLIGIQPINGRGFRRNPIVLRERSYLQRTEQRLW